MYGFEYCSWEPDVVFAWHIFLYFNPVLLLFVFIVFLSWKKEQRTFKARFLELQDVLGVREHYSAVQESKKDESLVVRAEDDPFCKALTSRPYILDRSSPLPPPSLPPSLPPSFPLLSTPCPRGMFKPPLTTALTTPCTNTIACPTEPHRTPPRENWNVVVLARDSKWSQQSRNKSDSIVVV